MSSRGTDGRLARVATALLGVAISVVLAGCASSTSLKAALAAERQDDYDTAVVEYTKALRERPDDFTIRKSLDRAKLRASETHFTRARRLSSTGKLEESLVEFELAAELNPANGEVQDELRSARAKLRAKMPVTREGKTQLETLIESSRNLSPPGLDLPHDARLPDSLVFRDASARDVFISIGRFGGVNVIFDPTYKDVTLSIELRGASVEDAVNAVCTSTHNFFKVTAPKS